MQINQSNLNPCWTDSSVDTGIGHTQTNEQNPHLSQSLKSHGWIRGASCNTYNNNAGLPSKSQY